MTAKEYINMAGDTGTPSTPGEKVQEIFADESISAEAKAAAVIGGATFVLALFAWGVFLRGLVLSILWNWFAAPVLGMPHIVTLEAYGLILVFTAFLGKRGIPKPDRAKKSDGCWFPIKAIWGYTWMPLLLYVLGWIVLQLWQYRG